MNHKARCVCDQELEIELDDALNLEDPSLCERIISGDFLSISCPGCGQTRRLEFRFNLATGNGHAPLTFVPESDRLEAYRSKLDLSPGHECVVGYRELREYVRIIQSKKDRRAIELLKYYLIVSSGESGKDVDPIVIFDGLTEDGRTIFKVYGLDAGRVGELKIDETQYQQCKRDLDSRLRQEPYSTFLSPPYISVRRLEFAD